MAILEKDFYELISPNYIRINRGNAGLPKTLEEAKNVVSSRIELQLLQNMKKNLKIGGQKAELLSN